MGVFEIKSRKGLIRVKCNPREDKIGEIVITGDFFIYPEDSLWIIENGLKGVSINRETIYSVLEKLVKDSGIEFIGSSINDFVEAIYCACSNMCGEE